MSLAQPVPIPPRASDVKGARLLARDVRIATLLLNDARYRVFQRVFAVERRDVNLVTLIALLIMAEKAHTNTRRLRAGRGPTLAEDFMGFGIVREALCRVAGPNSRDTPLLSTLLAIAVIGGAARSGLHGVRGSGHQADVAFHHRYGYLIDPGHWRQRWAQRRAAQAVAPV
ncbi:MAG: hypothetical protein ACXVHL_11950 [Solirubrobacteraceae bacterium]